VFEYDFAGRMVLSQVMTNGSLALGIAYGLDRVGNRTQVTGSECSGDYTMDSASPPADFEMNQYTTTPCDARSYDDNGNLVGRNLSSGTALVFSYDYADRLVSVSDSGTILARYVYDALGRRVSKTIFSGGAVTSTQFFYDGDNVIEEQNGGTTAATYVSGSSCGSGACLALRRDGQDYFIHRDDQGNALALTGSGGTVVERYDYDDYGAVTFLTSDGLPTAATTSSVGQVYCWGSLRLDPETGLLCNDGGDYFEPETGRTLCGRANIFENGSGRSALSNNPWSAGEPSAMKKGVVKFFNEAKGF
jgi:YD repeat-containing protein